MNKLRHTKSKLLIALTGISILLACEPKKSQSIYRTIEDSGFKEVKVLSIEPLQFNFLFNVRDFIVKSDYLIVSNSREDSLFTAINLNSMKVESSWGNRGRGPGEYGLFVHLIDMADSLLLIADFALKRFHTFSFPSLEEIEEISIINKRDDPTNSEIPQTIYAIDDSTFVYDKSDLHELKLTKWTQGQEPVNIYEFDDMIERFPENNFTSLSGELTINLSNQKLAYSHRFLNQFSILDFEGNIIRTVKKIPELEGLKIDDFENSILGYSHISSTKNSIFVYSVDQSIRKVNDISDTTPTYIEEFDWDGNPKNRYQVNGFLRQFEIWENDGQTTFIGVRESDESPLVLLKY